MQIAKPATGRRICFKSVAPKETGASRRPSPSIDVATGLRRFRHHDDLDGRLDVGNGKQQLPLREFFIETKLSVRYYC